MPARPSFAARRAVFRDLHLTGTFLVPNPWDLGSARLLADAGHPALATTSAGLAASLGRLDQTVTRDELVDHVAALVDAVDVPVQVDAEDGLGADPADVAATVEALAAAGAAGVSVEDLDPSTGACRPVGVAAERLGAAAEVAGRHGLVLTARAEAHLYGEHDVDETVERLRRFAEAGGDVAYAPGLDDLDGIRAVVAAVDRPVNVLLRRGGPALPALADAGVRRVSTGGSLALWAYGAMLRATEQLADGTWPTEPQLPREVRDRALGAP